MKLYITKTDKYTNIFPNFMKNILVYVKHFITRLIVVFILLQPKWTVGLCCILSRACNFINS